MKETPEEILIRLKDLVAMANRYEGWGSMIRLNHATPDVITELYDKVFPLYHSEMLKSSLPTEEEIENEAYKGENNLQIASFKNGAKYMLDYLHTRVSKKNY